MRQVRITHSNWVNDWLAGDAGALRYLTDDQAREAVEVHHLAVYADGVQPPPPVPVSADPVVTIEPQLQYAEELAAAEPGEADPGAEMKMPWTNASKAAWVDWAVHQGADPQTAAGSTKTELMSRYGERL